MDGYYDVADKLEKPYLQDNPRLLRKIFATPRDRVLAQTWHINNIHFQLCGLGNSQALTSDSVLMSHFRLLDSHQEDYSCQEFIIPKFQTYLEGNINDDITKENIPLAKNLMMAIKIIQTSSAQELGSLVYSNPKIIESISQNILGYDESAQLIFRDTLQLRSKL